MACPTKKKKTKQNSAPRGTRTSDLLKSRVSPKRVIPTGSKTFTRKCFQQLHSDLSPVLMIKNEWCKRQKKRSKTRGKNGKRRRRQSKLRCHQSTPRRRGLPIAYQEVTLINRPVSQWYSQSANSSRAKSLWSVIQTTQIFSYIKVNNYYNQPLFQH